MEENGFLRATLTVKSSSKSIKFQHRSITHTVACTCAITNRKKGKYNLKVSNIKKYNVYIYIQIPCISHITE